MKKITTIIIVSAVVFFTVGYILVILKIIEQNLYNQIATVIGGTASLLGLLSFVKQKKKTSDLKNLELETLKSLTKTAEEIKQKEEELSNKQSDLTKLELQKKELEFLVKKASLNLFLKERLENHYEVLEKQVSENREITRSINEIKELEYKVRELELEINENPNAENILKIIEESYKYKKTKVEIKTPLDFLFEPLAKFLTITIRK